MAKTTGKITFKAKLSRPATPKGAAWTFLVLPAKASAKLPTRSMVTVDDSAAEGQPFQATLEPDGAGQPLAQDRQDPARSAPAPPAGDTVALEIAPVAEEPKPQRAR